MVIIYRSGKTLELPCRYIPLLLFIVPLTCSFGKIWPYFFGCMMVIFIDTLGVEVSGVHGCFIDILVVEDSGVYSCFILRSYC